MNNIKIKNICRMSLKTQLQELQNYNVDYQLVIC